MKHTNKKHRHWLCAPLFLGVAFLSLGASNFGFTTANIIAPDTIQVLDPLESRKEVIGKGTYFVPTLSTLQVGSYTVTALDGLVYIQVGSTKTTFAAVTSTLHVEDKNGEYILIPSGYQWATSAAVFASPSLGAKASYSAKSLQLIPTSFIQELQRSLASLHNNTVQKNLHVVDGIYLKPLLLTKRSKEAFVSTELQHLLYKLEDSIESKNTAKQSELLVSITNLPIKTDVVHAILLWQKKSMLPSSVRATLLEHVFKSNSTLLKLASVHEVYKEVTWGVLQFSSATMQEEQVLLRFLDSYIDNGASQISVNNWKRNLEIILAQSVIFSEVLVHQASKVSQPAIQAAHPYRVKSALRTVIEVITPYSGQLSLATSQQFLSLQSTIRTNLPQLIEEQLPKQEQEIVIDDSYVGILSTAEIEKEARSILREASAIYGLNTEFKPAGLNSVQVNNIIFGGSTEDRVYSFTLQVKRGEVSDIIDIQKSYPNTMWIEDFVAWAKR